jgi:hypothetical protein
MKSIKTFKKFNENYSTNLSIPSNIISQNFYTNNLYPYDIEELGLTKEEDMKVRTKTTDTLNRMDNSHKLEIAEELEKLTKKFGCSLEDLTNPVFVKEFLDREIIMRDKHKELEGIQEGFGDWVKEKLLKFLSYIFQIGSTLGSLFLIISSAINNNFWGVFTGAIALTISILASAWISSKV